MNSSQFYTPKMTRINKMIIIATVSLFILSSVMSLSGGGSLALYLGLSLDFFLRGGVHTLFTFPFVGTGLFEVLFDCLLLWFLGCELEALWGRTKYLFLLLFSTLLSAVTYLAVCLMFPTLSSLSLTGLATFCNAMLVAYALIYPNRNFSFFMIFPIPAKWFCLILLGMQLYLGIFTPGATQAWGHMGGMLAGLLFIKGAKLTQLKKPSSLAPKKKNHLKLVKDEDNTPKYWQ